MRCAQKGIEKKEMNQTQKQFSLNRGASRKQIPISLPMLALVYQIKYHEVLNQAALGQSKTHVTH